MALHASLVQTLLSWQTTGVPVLQLPAAHTSPWVQASPSLQPLPSCRVVWVHTPWALQASLVQPLPSSQLAAMPAQTPPAHASPVVHARPSSQLLPSGL